MTKKAEFDLQDFLPYLLNQAAEVSSNEFQRAYKGRYGMLRTEWRVLFHLGIYGQLTAREIGLKARIHKTKVSRAVQRLAERRFLTRTRDPNDRRSEQLALTAAGTAAYRDLREIARVHDARMVAQFGEADAVLLRDMLKRLAGRD